MTKSRPRVTPPASSGRPGTAPVREAERVFTTHSQGTSDAFFRHIVSGMRNGVLAITRDGHLALINDEAYRIFGVKAQADDVGQPIALVLKEHPDVVRVLTGAFDLHLLPNRVEMRLKPSNKVIGYTVTFVPDDGGNVIGAAMFFKDLTRVEQLEERERLRDRLAAVGEMAAVIAHEVKNPLAGIEVMAGLLRRRIADTPDAAVLTDIIKEAKMANAIVQEVLDFVRPIRLQVEHTTVADAVQGAIQLADTKARRGEVQVSVEIPDGLPQIQADQHQLTQVFTKAPGIGTRARNRPEDRRCTRRTNRSADYRGSGHDHSSDAAGLGRRRGLEDYHGTDTDRRRPRFAPPRARAGRGRSRP